MKESHVEGLATHKTPSPAELLARAATLLFEAEDRTRCTDNARCPGAPCGRRPCARTDTPCTGTGRSPVGPRHPILRDASGSLRTHADDERRGEVRETRS